VGLFVCLCVYVCVTFLSFLFYCYGHMPDTNKDDDDDDNRRPKADSHYVRQPQSVKQTDELSTVAATVNKIISQLQRSATTGVLASGRIARVCRFV